MIKVIKLSLVVIFFSITYSYAKDVYLSCESTTKFRTSFIINDEKKTLILDGEERVLRSKFNEQGKFCRIYDSYISLNGAERGNTNFACKTLNNDQWEFYR